MKTQKQRRMQARTDYKRRLNLLKSGQPRIVVRKTNKYIISQYVVSNEAQDNTVFTVTSKSLLGVGWPESMKGSLKSIPAAYLTGFLTGNNVKSKNLDKPIVDLGMARMIKGSRLFAFIQGLVDSGIEASSKKEFFPSKDKIQGSFTKSKIEVEKIKSKIQGK